MEKLTLLSSRPTVTEFRRAVGAKVKKGVYVQHQDGRPYDAFAYILRGGAGYDFGDYTLDVHAGDILYLAKGSSYTMTVDGEYGFLFCNFLFGAAADTQMQCEAFPAPSGKQTEDLFHKLVAAWQRNTPTVKEDCLALLYMIYADFLSTATASYMHSDKRLLMEKAADYIRDHLGDEDLTIAKVAAAVHMGERHFRRTFKEAYNLSPLRYINMKRITRAKELLRYSDTPLAKIAAATGFSSIYYFSNAFKKEVHCSPSQYRKTKQKFPAI
ncbi:MAG: helix-turn-helix transcriptional regulator [Clostridia bacterium]|nr:helix-turn-helix transcriptional regulator [Clostridia bacterium]